MKLIKLTSLEGKKVIVNVDKIEALQTLNVNHSKVQLSNTILVVRESVSVIEAKLK
ncbi:MAG: hypothetical protein GY816_08350 [Cytophagales bacterium]|nr:hypothetical protein [Cytophagales bacterium]